MTNPLLRPMDEYEAERASNSYLMSVVAVIMGLPLPIINLIATLMFFVSNRRASYVVRWHCTQALISQVLTVGINVPGILWTVSIVWGDGVLTNAYIAYMMTIVTFNLVEFGATIYAATRARRGHHVTWWVCGPLSDLLVREK